HEARGDGLHAELSANRPEVLLRIEAHVLATTTAELTTVDAHHRVAHIHVLEAVDVAHVDDGRVVHHYVAHVALATPAAPVGPAGEARAPPPRNHGLTEAERAPAHERQARADGYADARRAEERHQRRRVHRRDDDGPRRPAPEPAGVHPAAVVVRRPAPRRVVDPRPLVVRVVDPPARAVRRPIRGSVTRDPHVAVLGYVAPVAVAVEVVDARDVTRDVLRAARRL